MNKKNASNLQIPVNMLANYLRSSFIGSCVGGISTIIGIPAPTAIKLGKITIVALTGSTSIKTLKGE